MNDVSAASEGWYLVKFKSSLSTDERDKRKLASDFNDWAFYDGKSWEKSQYDALGFYVDKVIKAEEDGDCRNNN